jgi:hypothetical protein
MPFGSSRGQGFNNPVATSFAAGNVRINLKGLFIYSGTPATGNLFLSVAWLAGTDKYGNAFQSGLTLYLGSAFLQMSVNPTIGAPTMEMATGAASESDQATIYTLVINKGLPNELISTYILGPASTLSNEQVLIQLVSAAANLSQIAQAVLYMGAGGVFTPIAFWNINGFRIINPVDGNTYTVGRAVTKTAGTVTVNSAVTPVPIVSTTVGVGKYRMRFHIVYVGGGVAASAILSWFGTSTVSNSLGTLRRARVSTSVDIVNPINQATALGNLTLPFNAGELCTYEFEGIVTFSASGTFGIEGLEGTAGDTWAVGTNSYMEMIPT